MVPCRLDPPLPVVDWTVTTIRLPLGTPVVVLTIAGAAVTLTRADAMQLGRDLSHVATPA